MTDYKHQCRYCGWCVFTMDECWWCDHKQEYITCNAYKPNNCADFTFCDIAADDPNKTYKPRKKSPYKQDRLFDMPTDKQKARSVQ